MSTCAIVLDYRNPDTTKKCLISLIGQGLATVYVVDNSQNEECTKELAAIEVELSGLDVDYILRIIGANRNLGFANGVNYAIRTDLESSSPHDCYLLINNDAIAHPGLVAQLQESIEKDNVLLAAPCISEQGTSKECGLWYNRYLGILTEHRTPLSFNYASGCCLLLRKQLINNNQLFDPAFFMYGEDALLFWKLHKNGMPYKIVKDAYVEHEVGASSTKSGIFYEYHTTRAHILMAVKARSNPLEIPLMLISKFISLSVRMIARCLRYRSLVPAHAFILAWLPFNHEISAPD